MNKYLVVLTFIICLSFPLKADNHIDTVADVNMPQIMIESAVISTLTYVGCRKLTDKKLACVLGGIIVANMLMYADFHTDCTSAAFTKRASGHFVGSMVVIPIAIFEK